MPNDYSYASGDGAVSLTAGSGSNSLQLGAGLSWPNVHLVKSGSDLVITDTVSGDTLDLSGEFAGGTPAIQSIVLGDGTTINAATALWATGNVNGTSGSDVILGGIGDEILSGGSGGDLIVGGIGNDGLYGSASNDTLIGGVGTQQLWGDGGNDTFIFGQGNQEAFGNSATGNDTYSYVAGDGIALIQDQGGTNVLRLGPGLTAANVKFSNINSAGDLYITDGIAGDQLELEYEDLYTGSPVIQTIVFGDGSTLTLENGITLTGIGVAVEGTQGNDTIYGTTGTQDLAGAGGSDTIIGGTGQDRLYGNAGNDTLIGGAGTQQLWGQGGNDLFIFGQGNQEAIGAAGDDTYSYSAGDGTAIILDQGGTNVLRLGPGLTVDNVTFSLASNGSDLYMTDTTAGDQLEIEYEAPHSASPVIRTVIFSDGTVYDLVTGTVTAVGSGPGVVTGGPGADTLTGGTGAQTLIGGGGNDSFIAGIGIETMIGGSGNDTYFYSVGDEVVSISDSGGTNVLQLGAGLSWPNVHLVKSGSDLVITDTVSGDTLDLSGEFAGGTPMIQSIVLGDGTTINVATALWATGNVNGTSGSDVILGGIGTEILSGGSGGDLIVGGIGNASLYGSTSNDTLIGGAGTQQLWGNGGNDVFIFGQGNQEAFANSTTGNDTYSYAAGDGIALIQDQGGTNVLKLGPGLTAANVKFSNINSAGDLYITDGIAGDQLEIEYEDLYTGSPVIPTIVFGDGSTLTLENGINLTGTGVAVEGSQGNDTIYGTTGTQDLAGAGGSDTIIGGTGQDRLYGNAGNDTLIGGVGTQQLWGQGGNDLFIFGQGNQEAIGAAGDDTYSYSAGDGTAIILDQGGANNVLKLGAGLTISNVTFSLTGGGGNLYITDGTAGDQLEVEYEYWYSTAPSIRTIIFGDGTTYQLSGGTLAEVGIVQGSGNGVFTGGPGDDTLIGGTGTETLIGGGGNDTFIAGIGTETLVGGAGNDTYSYAAGDGVTSITDSGGTNVLQLGAGLSWPNVHLVKSGNDLLITDAISGDTLDLSGEFAGSTPAIQTIVLGDGTTVNVGAAIWGSATGNVDGTSGNDLVFGGVGTENLLGNGGSDTLAGGIGTQWLYGNGGNDTLIGGVGTQQLWGNGGNDTFIFGQGNQIAFGGTGNDTYSYVAGGGTALIDDQGGANVLRLGPGLSAANISFSEINNYGDLYITDGIAGDQLEIEYEDLFSGTPSIPTIVFSDGSTMTLESGIAITGNGVAVYGSQGNDTIYGTTGTQDLAGEGGSDTLIGGSGQDRLYGNAGNDTLIGGAGTQQLWGNGGNDLFIFGQGSQQAAGGAGNDTYSYSAGDGIAVILDQGGTDNVLKLGSGMTISNVTFSPTSSGGDVYITDGATGDQLEIESEDWYSASPLISTIIFGDGTTYQLSGGALTQLGAARDSGAIEPIATADVKTQHSAQVANLVNAMAGLTPPAAGQTALPAAEASQLEPIIAANWH